MHINGPSQIHGPQSINAPHFAQRTQSSQGTSGTASTDRVEISQAAEAAMKATETGRIRNDLVNEIRSQIAAGTYDTPDKMNAAVDRLLDQIG
jgi:negative regulator of flagellin synthesis FlgM